MRSAFLVLLSLTAAAAGEDTVTLKDGFVLQGEVSLDGNRVSVRSGGRVYHFGSRQLLDPRPGTGKEVPEVFFLQQPGTAATGILESIRQTIAVQPFDDFGRRAVELVDERGQRRQVVQAIDELYPEHARLRGLDRGWRTDVPTSTIPTETLVAILHRTTDLSDGGDRLKIARFLIQADRFAAALTELDEVAAAFPDLASQAETLRAQARRTQWVRTLADAELALEVGQPLRADRLLAGIDRDALAGDLEVRHRLLTDRRAKSAERQRRSRESLVLSVRPIDGVELRRRAGEAIRTISQEWSPAAAERLGPVLDLDGIGAAERLAYVISGWVVGPALAVPDVEQALDLWRTRGRVAAAIGAADDVTLVNVARQLQSGGIGVDVVARLLPLLPAPATDVPPGAVATVTAESAKFGAIAYDVFLPPEYDRFRAYPTVVALHDKGRLPPDEIDYWREQASRNGLIVIAPAYEIDPAAALSFGVPLHVKFLELVADAKRRFAVDGDRLFLSGHGSGGMATWDLGMAHPDLFAGIVPVGGVPAFYCKFYGDNLLHLPVFAVEGRLHGDNRLFLQNEFEDYFLAGANAVYVDYPGRGADLFVGELPTIVRWMAGKRRAVAPAEVTAVSARLSDRRFYWLVADTFRANATVPAELFGTQRFKAARMEGAVADQQRVQVSAGGLTSLTLAIPQGLLQLDSPALQIRVGRKVVHRGPLTPDMEVLLETVRDTGDRQRLIVAQVRVPRL